MEQKPLQKELQRSFYKNNMFLFIITALFMVLISVSDLVLSYMMMGIIDATSGHSLAPLVHLLRLFTGVFFGYILIYVLQRFTFSRFMQKATIQYKEYAFEKLLKKNIASFTKESTSTYLSALTNDLTAIETNYLSKIFALLLNSVTFLGALAIMLSTNPLLTLIAIGFSFFPVLASILSGNKLAKEEEIVSKQNEGFMGSVKDFLSGFPVIKTFKAEQAAFRQFKQSNTQLEGAKYNRRMTNEFIYLLSSCAGTIAQFGTFFISAYLAITGQNITPGMIILFVQLMNYLMNPIGEIPPILANRKAAKALIAKLADALEENVTDEGSPVSNQLQQSIALKNLSFAYEEGKNVLNDISLTFEKGKSYAIVGASGSGKTTLLNLLMGSACHYSGTIEFDGVELRTISPDSLYSLISLVQQNVFVFNSSIKDNITMFRNFEADKINRAIKLSGLSALIEEKGLDYPCGENGNNLSGGEKQRLSIARALLQETSVLLLDEVTSALDAATSFEITSSILAMKSFTRLIVTHKLEKNLLAQYDEIIVLRDGQIVETGTFESLMNNKWYFYALYTVSADSMT